MDEIQHLDQNTARRTYLVTYSHLDYKKFPTRWAFGGAVVAAFGAPHVDYFVSSKEPHEEDGAYHYHVAIKLNKTIRWMSARDYLQREHDVNVNFSSSSSMYLGAYRYATKSDKQPFHGSVLLKHPNLDMISNTYSRALQANNTFRENRKRKSAAAAADTHEKPKAAKLKKADIALFVVENKIRNETELMKIATERRNLGDRCLYDYLFSVRRQTRCELVEDAWLFENASKTIENNNVDRMQKVIDQSRMECQCEGAWLRAAKEILENNSIDIHEFASSLRESLRLRRQKETNILLYGPTDCGKTFLLKPITEILPNVFSNPANSTFGWFGVENANLIFLNDFRWKPTLKKGNIEWGDLLNMLEGLPVTLPAPMNTCAKHIELKKQMPIFATSIEEVRYWVNHEAEPQTDRHLLENQMMRCRWKSFKFSASIQHKRAIPECSKCWAELVVTF